MKEFATKKYPLRCSKLPALSVCSLNAVQSTLALVDDEVGPPADTGSALHKAIETWHKNKHDKEAALVAMQKDIAKYPKAELPEAASMFHAYIQDPRNKEAEIFTVEEKIEFELNPADFDITKQPIVVQGTLDQLRIVNGTLWLWDVKSGQRYAEYMKTVYSLQLAAYAYGASIKYKKDIEVGGLIRTRTYMRKKPPVDPTTAPDGVFIHVDWTRKDIDGLLNIIRHKVALIRMNAYSVTPSEACNYCPIGLANCGNVLQQSLRVKEHAKEGNKKQKRRKGEKQCSTDSPFTEFDGTALIC